MLTRTVSYTTLDGEPAQDTLHFHFTQLRFLDFLTKYGNTPGDFEARARSIIDSGNTRLIVHLLKDFVLSSYGIRTDDGKRFIQNDEVRETFEDSLAFEAVIMEFMTNVTAMIEFIKNVIPTDLADKLPEHFDTTILEAVGEPAPPALSDAERAATEAKIAELRKALGA